MKRRGIHDMTREEYIVEIAEKIEGMKEKIFIYLV